MSLSFINSMSSNTTFLPWRKALISALLGAVALLISPILVGAQVTETGTACQTETGKTWTVDSVPSKLTCTSATVSGVHGSMLTLTDSTGPMTGTAQALCNNGVWTIQPGYTCVLDNAGLVMPNCIIQDGQRTCISKPSYVTSPRSTASYTLKYFGSGPNLTSPLTAFYTPTNNWRYNPSNGAGTQVEMYYGKNTVRLYDLQNTSYYVATALPQATCAAGTRWSGGSASVGICTSGSICTGTLPNLAQVIDAEEVTGLSSDTSFTHTTSDTATKCQFKCASGYTWNGTSCTKSTNTYLLICPDRSNVAVGDGQLFTLRYWGNWVGINPPTCSSATYTTLTSLATWKSSATDVATVSASGYLMPLRDGVTKITAGSKYGTTTKTITVGTGSNTNVTPGTTPTPDTNTSGSTYGHMCSIVVELLIAQGIIPAANAEQARALARSELQIAAPVAPPTTTVSTANGLYRCPTTPFTYTLKFGLSDSMTNGEVSKLQILLASIPDVYPQQTVSGYFGDATQLAVQRFQSRFGILTSGTPEATGYGVVGELTRAKLNSLCNLRNAY